ncbi:hypothetical protein [Longimicrobium sp.]|uniref:hypothetical protein n=1 Tax=Longimicrobium sp. TaxID=2029185 RepID=UPI003B3BC187
MRLRFRWTALLAGLMLVSACAPAASGPAPRDRTVISEEELTALPGGMNAFEAVQRLRPFWLNVRANRSFNATTAEVLVYQGDMRLGSADNLRNIRVSEVRRLEYFDPAQAVARLPGIGNSRPAGAIIVRMRAG